MTDGFLLGAAAFVVAMVALGLVRLLRGPTDADRMMAVQLIGTELMMEFIGHDGIAAIDVEAEAGRDVRAELAWAVVTRGFGLVGLQQLGMSLEEIFLHLTTTDAEEPASAA